jgi:hypothetical protein
MCSREDGVVRRENQIVPEAACIEVTGRHMGVIVNHHAYRAIADTLAHRSVSGKHSQMRSSSDSWRDATGQLLSRQIRDLSGETRGGCGCLSHSVPLAACDDQRDATSEHREDPVSEPATPEPELIRREPPALLPVRRWTYCRRWKKLDDYTREGDHVIPESLGDTWIGHRVCEACNNRANRIDDELVAPGLPYPPAAVPQLVLTYDTP